MLLGIEQRSEFVLQRIQLRRIISHYSNFHFIFNEMQPYCKDMLLEAYLDDLILS